MLCKRIIPCLDVAAGRVVKGVKFGQLRDCGDPVELARRYEAACADELVLLDITASHEGRSTMLDVVERLAYELSIPFTVGGGVSTIEHARSLLRAGADKIAVNSAAVRRPALVAEIAGEFGSQCCVLAVDARRLESGAWEVLVNGGRETCGRDVQHWVKEASMLGAGEVLLTSWDSDGTRTGFDMVLNRAIGTGLAIPLIASGGAGSAQDFIDALRDDCVDAALAAGIFHDGQLNIAELKQELASAGIPVRLCDGE